ncbi:lipopolysaccharide heptosyltransferase II [candidate division KSB3 bacterium]|uniref:lipopolysaccharide heptosyltransferase II n=1 Tax=candidate division KSB3 bacterium TaxID=2044937 RepID=A0A2G6KGW2_9BACT|nr:MAG: lipopolysaccharide heptosyltransferase II [candidate division KSB3 bacterium]
MSLPFFDMLGQYFPHSTIDIIAKETITAVFENHPAIRTIYHFSKSHVRGFWSLFQYGRGLKDRRYDLFITLAPSFSSALIGYGTDSPIRVGYSGDGRSLLLTHTLPAPQNVHRVQAYCDLLGVLNSQPGNQVKIPDVVFPFSEKEQGTSGFSKQAHTQYIVFNVNSEAQSRRLPLKTWIELADRLLADTSQKRKIFFIGTTAEQARVQQVMQHIHDLDALYDFSGKTSLGELALILRDSDVVVSNDSGPMHLANAVGTPVVTFFGAGNTAETAPFNAGQAVVLNKHVACSPCVKNVCRFPIVRCLEQITVDEIYGSILQLLS